MSKFLKQSTAAHIMFGVFVDKTDGVTLEVAAGIITSIDHATTGIFLSKNGAAGAIRHQNVTASVLDAYGMFQVHLDTTDTDTVGNLRVMMAEAATFLPVWDDYVVLPANVYDSLMGTDKLDVNAAEMADDLITAGKFDESTAFPVKKADATTTELARLDSAASYKATGFATPTNITAASGVTLAALQSGVTIPTVTTVTNAPTGMALEASLTAIKGATWTNQTLEKIVSDIAAISAGSGASVADILNALLASYTVSGSVGESLGRLDNIQAKTDLITTGTTLTITSAVVGSTITAHRGDTLSAALENIGALTNNSKLWFTVKRDADDADSASIIQIEKTGGLLYINGAVGTAGNGSLTINDVPTGDVTIVLNASETAKLNTGNYSYDIQILRSAGTPVSTLTYGEFIVESDVTKVTA